MRLGWFGNDPRHRRPWPTSKRVATSSLAAVLWPALMPVVTEFVTLLADFVTHSIGLTDLSGIRAGRFEEPGMCSVGSGMVLAIGDLAGATFVTLLAAHGNTVRRAGRLWTLMPRSRIELPCGWAVGNGPRHRRPSVAAVLSGI